jgi:hypothetical protein
VLWVASPYSRGGVIDHYYTQVNMVRTIEQILGIQPMNQEDRAAAPMYAAFTGHPNFSNRFTVQPNQIPLDLGTPGATAAARVGGHTYGGPIPAAERGVYAMWVAWSAHQGFNGPMARQDRANPAQLNRLDWYSAHNWMVAYPGDPKIYAPDQVPGRNLPASWLGDG